MNTYELINTAAEAGKAILENGGETYRAEETISKICSAYGNYNVETFAIPTGIIISMKCCDNKTVSTVKRIKKRTVDLEKVKEINDLSRKIVSSPLPIEDFKKNLNKIINIKTYEYKIRLIFACIAAFSFTLLFGGTMRDSFVSFFIGGIIYKISSYMNKLNINDFFINIIGGGTTATIAILSVYLNIGINIDNIIIGSVMLLVPGLAITNAIRDTLAGDLVSGMTRTIEAFLIAVAIAIGSGIVLKIFYSNLGGTII